MPKMVKASDSHVKNKDVAEDAATSARDKFKGELLKLHDSDSSDSDEYRPKTKAPKKKGDRVTRRSKMRNYVRPNEAPAATSAFVMKLFDRSVDLTQFTSETPLYPICRAWFRNNPKDNIRKDPFRRKEEKVTSSKDVFRLPSPLPSEDTSESLSKTKVNISDDFSIDYDQSTPLPSKEELLEKHMEHWAEVRHHKRLLQKRKDKRYQRSFDAIRKIFTNRI